MSSVQLIKVNSDFLSPNQQSYLSLLTPQSTEELTNIGHIYESLMMNDLRKRVYTIKHKTQQTQSTKDLYSFKLYQLKQINQSISKTINRYKKMISQVQELIKSKPNGQEKVIDDDNSSFITGAAPVITEEYKMAGDQNWLSKLAENFSMK